MVSTFTVYLPVSTNVYFFVKTLSYRGQVITISQVILKYLASRGQVFILQDLKGDGYKQTSAGQK